MNECFFKETVKTVEDIKNNRKKGDVCFAVLSDTHLCDTVDDTVTNIREVDKNVGFDFLIHLGGIINGNNPEKISRWMLSEELEKFRSSISNRKLFVAKGKTDGYRDETFCGQLVENIMTDDMWYDDTAFIHLCDGVSRKSNKPYYYVDIPGSNLRIVVLSSFAYEIDKAERIYDLSHRFGVEQLVWLKKEALNVNKEKTVLIFSNTIPCSRFSDGKDPFIYHGHSTEKTMQIIQTAQKQGVSVAGWICGGYGYDYEAKIAGINYITINTQLPRIDRNAMIDDVKYAQSRELNSVNQDCWDAVIVSTDERKIKMFRFGAGEDRVIEY